MDTVKKINLLDKESVPLKEGREDLVKDLCKGETIV